MTTYSISSTINPAISKSMTGDMLRSEIYLPLISFFRDSLFKNQASTTSHEFIELNSKELIFEYFTEEIRLTKEENRAILNKLKQESLEYKPNIFDYYE
jgi:hypothetical protein